VKQRIARSYLFVPGNRPDRFEKALAAGAHEVIVDLEDAVPPAEKTSARETVASWLRPETPVIVRINSAETDWFRSDVTVCRTPGVRAIMLPKTGGVEHLRSIEDLLRERAAVLPLIETARGFSNALDIARDPAVERLVFGAIDFQLDLGIRGNGEELLYFRSQLVLLSRLAGIDPPVDGINTEIDDPEQLRADTLRARRLGFGGKLCIHPKQVPHVNQSFLPSPAEIAWARRVVDAAQGAGGSAVANQGHMVDRPVLLDAERILEEAGEIPTAN
jgi:citrate lyase subunit beta/citryl-CoA lyase